MLLLQETVSNSHKDLAAKLLQGLQCDKIYLGLSLMLYYMSSNNYNKNWRNHNNSVLCMKFALRNLKHVLTVMYDLDGTGGREWIQTVYDCFWMWRFVLMLPCAVENSRTISHKLCPHFANYLTWTG